MRPPKIFSAPLPEKVRPGTCYDFAANLCQKQELQAMAFIFQATAKQEQAHAKVFWDHLQALNGQNLPIYGAYPH